MTNTTETYWDIDGVSLQTFAYNIVTLGGERESVPAVRGDDLVVPFRPGVTWLPKVPDAKTLTLGMWVMGSLEDGTIPAENDPRREFQKNWKMLRRLLFTPRRQFVITKRFWVLEEELAAGGYAVDALPRSGDWRLISASALGSFAGGLIPQMTGPSRANFTVDIKLSSPYFYSPVLTFPMNMTTTPERTITVLGDDRTTAIGVVFTGPLTGPKIENETSGVWFRYNASIAGAQTVTVDVHDFEASRSGSPATPVAGNVDHDGDAFWFYLDPGETDLKLTATGGSGTAVLSYQPGWF